MKRRILFFLASSYYRFCASIIYIIGGIEAVNLYLKKIGYPITVLKMFGAKINDGTIIYPGITIHSANKNYSNLIIGNNCRILRDCFIDLNNKFVMKDYSAIGSRVMVITHNNFDALLTSEDNYNKGSKPVILEKKSVVSSGVILLMGTIIGKNSIVGSGSVISGKVQDNVLIMGNPPRVLKKLK